MLEHINVTQERINWRLLTLELGLGPALELGLGNWKGSWTKRRINAPLMTA